MFKSLSDIRNKVDQSKQSRSSRNDTNEGAFLKLKDGESVKLRFAQEFDSTGPYFDERWSNITVVEEHVNPDPSKFMLRAVCSLEDEGKCWGCEQTSLPEIGYKWRPKMRMYANVVVETPEGPKVKILASGFGDEAVASFLLEYAAEFGSTMDRSYKLSRSGVGLDTSYKLFPVGNPGKPDLKKLEPIDATKFVKFLPYAEQAAYLSGESKETGGKPSDWVS